MTLESDYRERFNRTLTPIATDLVSHLTDLLVGVPRVDRITARPKGVSSFLEKANKPASDGTPKYHDPLSQIQDQIGARIITFYKDDTNRVLECVKRYLRAIEDKDKLPESEWEFGYFGHHSILLIPNDLILPEYPREQVPQVFELQIKTLFQHAWSEADHDLGYKPTDTPFLPDEKRLLAFASAQAWGADRIFNDLFRKQQANQAE